MCRLCLDQGSTCRSLGCLRKGSLQRLLVSQIVSQLLLSGESRWVMSDQIWGRDEAKRFLFGPILDLNVSWACWQKRWNSGHVSWSWWASKSDHYNDEMKSTDAKTTSDWGVPSDFYLKWVASLTKRSQIKVYSAVGTYLCLHSQKQTTPLHPPNLRGKKTHCLFNNC